MQTQQPVIDPKRLEAILNLPLKSGGHKNFKDGMCVMEAVAFVAGEPWSDSPECASPVIAAFLRQYNDRLPNDAVRTELLGPLVEKLVGSKALGRCRGEAPLPPSSTGTSTS